MLVKIGNQIINLTAVLKIEYTPPSGKTVGSEPQLWIVTETRGSLTFYGSEADLIWEKLRKVATPIEDVGRIRETK